MSSDVRVGWAWIAAGLLLACLPATPTASLAFMPPVDRASGVSLRPEGLASPLPISGEAAVEGVEPGSELFTPADHERGAEFARLRYLCFFAHQGLVLAALWVLGFSRAGRALAGAVAGLAGGPWWAAVLFGLAMAAVVLALTLPVAFLRGYVLEHRYGLSEQTPAAWLLRWVMVRGLHVGAGVTLVVAMALAARRWPRGWWVVGGLVFALLSAGYYLLEPVLFAPMFDRLTPLPAGGLRDRVVAIARRGGIEVERVYLSQVSRRTRRVNAYITGLGTTRSIVLHDTLLERGSEGEVLSVVGHEVGHLMHRHLEKGLALGVVGMFAVLWLAAPLVRRWHPDPADPTWQASLGLVLSAMILLTMPVVNAFSRPMEAQADWESLRLTDDPESFIRSEVVLAHSNVAELRPGPWVELWFYTHPPVLDRIGMAREYARARGTMPRP